ncbi:glycosyltransferase [Vibrio sp. 10N.286.49.B3]|uniref:MJ1255/VC2487 family glycosyltransferase n=1 Tax=Vibrio sp. 10N.286.49.B3 TaxID=1880855 RepID=UPI000C83EB0A|nr:MJ1255/VC2487 family glycosyltransferase [Vibrio sp. 10N.286.49.B3]PMH39845.1 glycosyltransferase [Vibrio sp. 10N.286.49.B3]
MKILYGVQGTGNGHISRARAMCHALSKRDVEVDFLFSGREKSRFFAMEEFGDFTVRKGLTFISENGQVNYVKSALNNNPLQLMKEIKQLDLSQYDLVLNDFEPISAWAAKQQKVPCISISHQNAFRHDVPKKEMNWLDHQLIKNFAPADYYVALHWYHFSQSILPPIIHSYSQSIEPSSLVLVYLPFESLDNVTDLLMRFSGYNFVCYHPDVIEPVNLNHIHLKPLGLEGFQQDLRECQGVIANGGFELPSEALALGKKLLLKPLDGQFEQQSNVATLEELGLAQGMAFLDPSKVRDWLDSDDAEKVRYPDVAHALADWIVAGEWQTQTDLFSHLWDRVDFPSYASVS